MGEFRVNDQGQLDLGIPDAAGERPTAVPGDWWADPEGAGLVEVDPADLNQDDYVLDPGDDEPAEWFPPDVDPGLDDDEAVFVAGMPADVRAEYLAGPFTGAGEKIQAGFLHHGHDGPSGVGFAAGGVLDGMKPGDWLAKALAAATADGHEQLGESELIGVLCGWRRMQSWAAAGEAAAVLTLAQRRIAAAEHPRSSAAAEHVTDEVACALTLTGRSASRLLSIATGLARLPQVRAALEQGQIDWPKTCVFVDEVDAVLDDILAQGIAARFLGRSGAGGWTTGQLRAALRRAVLAADPEAADRRRTEARKDAAVQAFAEASGNAGLAGRELPVAEVLAADRRLTNLARWLQRRGAEGTVGRLRPAVYTALLNGKPIESLLAELAADAKRGPAGPGAAGSAAGPDAADDNAGAEADAAASSWPAVSGTIHLTMPMSAFTGGGQPGEVAGHGPIDAATSRQIAAMLAKNPATKWCLTLTGADGRAAAHACARRGPLPREPVLTWAAGLRDRLGLLEAGTCSHARQSPGYVPPGTLRHLIGVRQRTCSHPGCRRAAARCDLDHTVPYDQGGRTCWCNLAPLCRHHHRCKQAPGWQLTQSRPGEMTWRAPSGRIYQTTGDPY